MVREDGAEYQWVRRKMKKVEKSACVLSGNVGLYAPFSRHEGKARGRNLIFEN